MSGPRSLVSIRREVPPGRRADYDAAWEAVRAEAATREAHAWRFAAVGRDDLFLEFLEFAATADPRRTPELSAALARLDGDFAATVEEEWEELQ